MEQYQLLRSEINNIKEQLKELQQIKQEFRDIKKKIAKLYKHVNKRICDEEYILENLI